MAKDDEKKKGLAGFLSGPIGDLLLGTAMGTAMTGNPLTGLLAAPVVNKQRQYNRAAEQRLAEEEFNLSEKQRLSKLAQELPIMANAGKNPITGEMVAPEPGITDPYMDQGQRLGVAAQMPHLTNTLFPQASNRMNPAQMYSFFTEKMGRDPNEDELKAIMGLDKGTMTPEDQLSFMKLQLDVEKLRRELAGDVAADTAAAQEEVQLAENLTYELQTMGKALDQLEGSPLAPGGGYVQDVAELALPVAEFATRLFGEDAMADQIAVWRDNANLFKKSSSRFAGQLLRQMNNEGITVTRGLQQLVEEMGANPGMSIGSIRVINQMAARELLQKYRDKLTDESLAYLQQTASGYDGNFGSLEEAQIAEEQGMIQPGETFYINGRAATVD